MPVYRFHHFILGQFPKTEPRLWTLMRVFGCSHPSTFSTASPSTGVSLPSLHFVRSGRPDAESHVHRFWCRCSLHVSAKGPPLSRVRILYPLNTALVFHPDRSLRLLLHFSTKQHIRLVSRFGHPMQRRMPIPIFVVDLRLFFKNKKCTLIPYLFSTPNFSGIFSCLSW